METPFSPFKVNGKYNSVVKGSTWPKFKLIGDFVPVLVAYKFDKDPIKVQGDTIFPIKCQLKLSVVMVTAAFTPKMLLIKFD